MGTPQTKVILYMTPETIAALDAVADRSEATRTDVVNRAIQVYSYLQTLKASGVEIILRDKNGRLAEAKWQ